MEKSFRKIKHLDIIVHCHKFSKVLMHLLSSLSLHTPENLYVEVYVPCSLKDKKTTEAIEFFRYDEWLCKNNLSVYPYYMDDASLFARAIGRNQLAKNTKADLVWFADADYYFGEGCLDKLAELSETFEDDTIYFPGKCYFNKTKVQGDACAQKVTEPGVYKLDTTDFVSFRYHRAIGGIQIVTGNTARKHGYCDSDSRSLKPSPEGWRNRTACDVRYRRLMGKGFGTKIDLPNLYRIRQSVQGVVDLLDD